jgi:CHASE2 domain-containing sensor protein
MDNTTQENQPVKISSMLEDNSGGLSSIRILMLLWGVGILLIWAFGSIMAILHGLPFPTLPPEIVTILLGVTGLKTVQRGFEKA